MNANKKIKALILLANGFEEIEALTPIDLLRRAGIEVTIAGLGNLQIKSARNVEIICETKVESVKASDYNAIILPGGGRGAENLSKSKEVVSLISQIDKQNGLIAAICASPAIVLGKNNLLNNRKFTCFPGCQTGIKGNYTGERVTVDKNLISSLGAGSSIEFSLAIIKYLIDENTEQRIKNDIHFT